MTSARQPQPDPAVLAQLRRRLLAEHADWLHGTRTVVRNRIVRRPSGLIGIDLDPVAEAIRSADQALEIIALSIEFFAQLGWAPSGSMPLAVYEAAIRAVADGMTAEDAEEILVKGWNDQLVLLRIHHRVRGLGLGVDDEVASWYQDRGRLVRRAWEHHVAGAFEAAIPMVFAQIDGITADATTTPATPAGRMFFSTRPGRQAEVVDDTTLAGMDDALPVVREYFSIGRHVTGALGSEARHGVMHGRELHYDTRANSTKAFVLLAAVVEWARPRVQALIERRRAERDQRYAGSDETDAEGRRLDRRGFVPTRSALRALGFTQAGFWREHGRFASMEELIGDPMSSLLDETETITVELATTSEWWAWRRSESGWGFAIGCSGDDPLAFRYYDGKAVPKDGPLGTGWLTSDASHWSGDWA